MLDDELINQFESCTLPFDQWTHRAHIKVAYLYVRDYPLDEAIKKMRCGIKAFNATNKVPEGPTTGYNETTTVAFMHLIAAVNTAYSSTFPTPDADSFCDTHPQLLCKHILRLFYSPERRSDPNSKIEFVEPDLCPLPAVIRATESE